MRILRFRIGAAIVKSLASDGANVALTYSNSPDRANEVVKAAQASGARCLAIQADSADATAVLAAVERTVSELSGIDILFNNAAIASSVRSRVSSWQTSIGRWRSTRGVAAQAAVKHMKDGGRIINIGSTNAERMPFAGGGVYAMSKSALHGLVQGLARPGTAGNHDQQRATRPGEYGNES